MPSTSEPRPVTGNPWHALWALMVGFFMILVDATIVAVANPVLMEQLDADYDAVIWVTSAYLLAYAVPLLVAGRLGDRFGPKNVYLLGLAVFTAASLWCGLAGSIDTLIAARVVQGIGAALLTPQTLSTITRIFPPERRGVAMSVWGATAGVATLVGPLAGGVLVDHLGWQWIFFVNVPVGLVGLALAFWRVPALPTSAHRFDLLGVLLSGVGMFAVVFGLQEGQSHDWQPWIWAVIVSGIAVLAGFGYWQAVNPHEPLIPLRIFADRDFSLSSFGVAVIGFVVTGMIVPAMFYAQAVCGLTPTESALLTAPMAIASGVLAPVVGRIVDRAHPRPIIGFGFSALAIALTWLSIEMTPDTPIWRLLLPFLVMGVGMAFIWSPLAATATRNLTSHLAGAGSGVYNATRQVGSVLGSASMAAFMTSRISAEMPSAAGAAPQGEGAAVSALPESLQVPFAAAMSQSLLLPAFVALIGVVAAIFLRGFGEGPAAAVPPAAPAEPEDDGYFDDDEYLEYAVSWDDLEFADPPPSAADIGADDSVTQPLVSYAQQASARPEPSAAGADPWRRVLDELLPEPPVRPTHNGFHVEAQEPPSNGRRRRYRDESDGVPEWLRGIGGPSGRHSQRD
ncbi:MFS transporter [Mycolicibacterium litorale]|uniref:MFS transporter n=1 Tax=Mycolicibacterium litorale TaxID=758802 RepID=UPI003CFB4962